MKVAYLPLKKNTTYGGMKFVPTSEVCVVRRNQSFWREIRRQVCLQWHAGGCAVFRGNLWAEFSHNLWKSILYIHVNIFSKITSITFTVMRRLTTCRSKTDRIYDGGTIRLYYITYHCVTIAYSIYYSNMLIGLQPRSDRLYHIA